MTNTQGNQRELRKLQYRWSRKPMTKWDFSTNCGKLHKLALMRAWVDCEFMNIGTIYWETNWSQRPMKYGDEWYQQQQQKVEDRRILSSNSDGK